MQQTGSRRQRVPRRPETASISLNREEQRSKAPAKPGTGGFERDSDQRRTNYPARYVNSSRSRDFSHSRPNHDRSRSSWERRSHEPREGHYSSRETYGEERAKSNHSHQSYHSRYSRERDDRAAHRGSSHISGSQGERRPPGQRVETLNQFRDDAESSRYRRISPDTNNLLEPPPIHLPPEALAEALGEVRDVMIQYTNCADPSESAARKERMRQAEEAGQMEETAERMVRASLDLQCQQAVPPPEIISPPVPQGRIPVALRLVPSPDGASVPKPKAGRKTAAKRKPGRPPVKKKIQISPKGFHRRKLKKEESLATGKWLA